MHSSIISSGVDIFFILLDNNAIHSMSTNIFAVKVRDLFDLWGNFFTKNQFDILSIDTRDVINNKFNSFGRRFTQEDFEEVL